MNLESIPKLCPRWDRCSVNNCPLDPRYAEIFTHPADKERRCPMEKNVRLRISAQFPGVLKFGGRTKPEHAAFIAYEAKPVAVKSQMAQRGKDNLQKLKLQPPTKTKDNQ